MPGDPILLLALAAGAVVMAGATLVVARRPDVGLWLFAAVALASMRGWGPQLAVAGVQVYPLDAATAVLAATVGVRSLRRRRRRVPVLLAALIPLVVLATMRGIQAFGTQQAVNASRDVLYVLVAILFASTCLPADAKLLLSVWKAGAAVLLVSAAWFLATSGLGSPDTGRALISGEALLVAQAGLLTLHHDRSVGGRWFAAGCLAAVLVSQQRTVWAATVLMVVLYAIQPATGMQRRAVRSGRRLLAAGVLAVALVLLVGPPEVRERTTGAVSAEAVGTENTTFAWRLESWGYLIGKVVDAPLADQFAGHPMGTSLERTVAGLTRAESAHNMYVMTLIWTGAAGLVLYVGLLVGALRDTRGKEPALYALVGGLAVFSIGYQLLPLSGLVLGSALVARSARTRAGHSTAAMA